MVLLGQRSESLWDQVMSRPSKSIATTVILSIVCFLDYQSLGLQHWDKQAIPRPTKAQDLWTQNWNSRLQCTNHWMDMPRAPEKASRRSGTQYLTRRDLQKHSLALAKPFCCKIKLNRFHPQSCGHTHTLGPAQTLVTARLINNDKGLIVK